jgi:hypothetical protein
MKVPSHTISPIGRDHMNMRVPCLLALRGDEVVERLNTGNRAGENVIASEHAPSNLFGFSCPTRPSVPPM